MNTAIFIVVVALLIVAAVLTGMIAYDRGKVMRSDTANDMYDQIWKVRCDAQSALGTAIESRKRLNQQRDAISRLRRRIRDLEDGKWIDENCEKLNLKEKT